MYNKKNYIRIKASFAGKQKAAKDRAEAHKAEVEAKYPDFIRINEALASTGIRIFEAVLGGKADLDTRIANLKKENEELLEDRGTMLLSVGYPADYLDIKYECPLCEDTGFAQNGEKLCACMRRELILAGYESSGIGDLLHTQSFESFSLSYAKTAEEKEHLSRILESARRYAETFSTEKAHNLLLFGATGLGKTHLSTAIAKTVIDRGFDVYYDTAQNIFADFESERFDRAYNQGEGERITDRYFECDLLIIDDLGTEMVNQFTVSCLYNLLNTRLNHAKSTVLNTNLSHADILRRYGERISSRLLGEYYQMPFIGSDVRMEKLRRDKGNA